MANYIKKEQYKGYEICIEQDNDARSPREEFSNLGTMVTWHRRYQLGDDRPQISRNEWKDSIQAAVILPVYMYDHSGITIATAPFSCNWDSGLLGYIYVTEETLIKEQLNDKPREEIEAMLNGEIETYDQYLRGEVYGYFILKDNEIMDSVWGYYGDHETSGLLSDARGVINSDIKRELKAHFKQLKNWIHNKVPLIYRKPAF